MKRIVTACLLAVCLFSLSALLASAEQTSGTDGGESFYASALTFAKEHLPLLLSTLTLVATGALARLFRHSVLPILEGGMKRVGGGVAELEGQTKALIGTQSEQGERMEQVLLRMESWSRGELSRLASLDRVIGESLAAERRRIDAVLEMLKEVFTAARLPAASKLALEEIYLETSKMKGRVDKKQGREEGSA